MMEDEEIALFGFCPWKEDYTGYLLEGISDKDILVIMNASVFLPEQGNKSPVDA